MSTFFTYFSESSNIGVFTLKLNPRNASKSVSLTGRNVFSSANFSKTTSALTVFYKAPVSMVCSAGYVENVTAQKQETCRQEHHLDLKDNENDIKTETILFIYEICLHMAQ